MLDFVSSRWVDILFRSYQHASLVVQSLVVATIIALLIAMLVSSRPWGSAVANAVSSIGLTLPSLALLGLAVPLVGIGTLPSVLIVIFYATLPILRNAIVGMQGLMQGLVTSDLACS
ncbi:hypothetical protein [Brevibacterium sp.]|uniref:hypothetical protein n=1 Tax=Brevibacterium sp. TaxID=1701 RepID=UPI002648C6FF|nr:hypothetical protein [Brevibacterium sp.]